MNTVNDFKPRKWLVILLIIIALAITVALIKKVITVYQEKTKTFNSSIQNDYEEKYNETKNQIDNARKKMELDSFNSPFEMYTGTEFGSAVSSLLNAVITNNKKNQEHLLTVIYGTHNTTNPEEITNIKKELDDWHKYEVSLDYDEDGYANKITIQE